MCFTIIKKKNNTCTVKPVYKGAMEDKGQYLETDKCMLSGGKMTPRALRISFIMDILCTIRLSIFTLLTCMISVISMYSKTCLKQPLKNRDKTKVVKTNSSLMKVESIAECSLGAFCNTFDLH